MTDIDAYIQSYEGWQKKNLETFRLLVHEVIPDVTEEVKWGVPVFSHNGKMICAMSNFKAHTKYNFFHGAALEDKNGLFNSGLDSKEHRSINLADGEMLDPAKLKTLIAEASIST